MSYTRFVVEFRADELRYALIDRGEDGSESLVSGEESIVDFAGSDAIERVFYHTEVSKDYSGQGLASLLVNDAVDDAIAQGMRIVPVCPYVVTWFDRHPEYAEHRITATPAHLRAIAVSKKN